MKNLLSLRVLLQVRFDVLAIGLVAGVVAESSVASPYEHELIGQCFASQPEAMKSFRLLDGTPDNSIALGVRTIPTLALLATVIQAAPVSSVAQSRSSQAIEAIWNDCYVDVGPSEAFRVIDVVEVDSNGKNRTLKARFRATVRGTALNGDLTFVCASAAAAALRASTHFAGRGES